MARTLEEHAAELQEQGYTIVENVLNQAEIKATNAALDRIFEREKEIKLGRCETGITTLIKSLICCRKKMRCFWNSASIRVCCR